MPYKPDHKQQTRARIVKTAVRLFNRKGFADVTIGEIMTAAGLTHGGFYRHFRSKEELYVETVRHFLHKEAPARWQKGLSQLCEANQPFAKSIVDAYLSRDHLEDVDGSCPLIGLSSDVARSAEPVKVAYRDVAKAMIGVFESNLEGHNASGRALVYVALCVGSMVLGRALDDQVLADQFSEAAKQHILRTSGW
jgi:TetR/AcrR family transcriptional regulator, transcriptional repressor for nem operon